MIGLKPTIDYFCIFGSISFALVKHNTKEKLDVKSYNFNFVAYSEKSKAYCLIDLTIDKLIVSRDVIVH